MDEKEEEKEEEEEENERKQEEKKIKLPKLNFGSATTKSH